MNIKITHDWLLEYLDTDATPLEIQKYLSLCGPSIERIEETNGMTVYDIEITSNRIDTASVRGIAQEAAAILPMFGKKAVLKKKILVPPTQLPHPVSLTITDHEGVCKRVLGIVLDISKITDAPLFMHNRLTATGVRSLNNVVDVTNYVMGEIGHPTHVFDYDRIMTHTLHIRHAKKGESITTLDEKKYDLDVTDIVIDDGTGRVIDLPGIMGTANSVVTQETKRILFFIESNDPVSIRRTSMRYGIRTMASTINEKGPDAELALTALLRGIELFKEVAGAKLVGNLIDLYPTKQHRGIVKVRKSFIDARVGISIPLETVVSILTNLGFGVKIDKEELTVEVPTYRVSDVTIPEDIIEEVARVYGYFAIPSILQKPAYITQPSHEELLFWYQYAVKSYLKHRGMSEVMNYSATSLSLLKAFNLRDADHLYITNSISEDIKYLRSSLIPSLVKNMKQNEGFHTKLRLFELAKTYIPRSKELPREEFMLTIAVNTSLEDLKEAVWGLFNELHIDMEVQTDIQDSHYFLRNAQAGVFVGKKKCGQFGQIKPQFCRNLNLETNLYIAEFSFDSLIAVARKMPVYHAFCPFAHITQDLTIPHTRPFANLQKIAHAASPLLESVSVQDTYKDTITLRFVFTNPSRHLTEDEAKKELENIKSAMV